MRFFDEKTSFFFIFMSILIGNIDKIVHGCYNLLCWEFYSDKT